MFLAFITNYVKTLLQMMAALLQIRAKIITNYSSSIFSKLLIIIANCVNFYNKFQQFSLQIASKIIIIDMYIHALLFTREASVTWGD